MPAKIRRRIICTLGEDGVVSTTFDTLPAARDLEAAGAERKQAEAHAEALRQAATARSTRVRAGRYDAVSGTLPVSVAGETTAGVAAKLRSCGRARDVGEIAVGVVVATCGGGSEPVPLASFATGA